MKKIIDFPAFLVQGREICCGDVFLHLRPGEQFDAETIGLSELKIDFRSKLIKNSLSRIIKHEFDGFVRERKSKSSHNC